MDFVLRFPNVFRPVNWDHLHTQFEYRDKLPPENLIANVNMVPYVENRWVIIRLADGIWEIPGGTLESGESYLEAIRRELREEAGATLHTFVPFGAWKFHSDRTEPYRPHLPHPDSYRVVGYGAVRLDAMPLNPARAEQVTLVEAVPLDEVVRRFSAINRHDLAEVYQLAAAIRG